MILATVTAGLNAIAYAGKAVAAYLGLVHDAKMQDAGITKQVAADQAAIIKGDADARRLEAQIGADTDAAQLERLHQQRDALTNRK